ncbi:MAG: tetratricopeptide repeat protein [Kiritimatiellae bacterium]|jgi:tetratricopeptide (TPR) repeat protein|nr:tetratricopeptide repeat protein [Kiritimatiellia bacterium]
MNMRKMTGIAVITAMLLATGAAMAADIGGVVVTKDGKKIPCSVIKWKSRDNAYAVTKTGAVKIELLMTLDTIDRLDIPKPKELETVQAGLKKGGNAAAAIPILIKIITDYNMLNWDKTATRLLADAYIKNNDASKAIKVCEKIISSNPEEAYKGDLAPVYWNALLMGDRVSKLDDLITQAIKSGKRSSSAFALIMRGDMINKASDTNENAKKALRDGYLRVVTLYSGIKAAQPEALYKAAKCFDKLGQTSRADQMRTTLKGEFSSSEWALK